MADTTLIEIQVHADEIPWDLFTYCISNYIYYKIWDEISYPFQTSMAELLKLANG